MFGKISKKTTAPLLLAVLLFSGCVKNPKSSANDILPVLHNAGNGLTSAYATTLSGSAFTEPSTDDDLVYEIPEHEQIVPGQILAEFETDFGSPKTSRAKNIELAAESIDGKIIYPDEVFSFNEATGPTTQDRGYRLARIFVRGIEKKGFGGGVCQVSSTLYNTAVNAGMEIIERHPHSKEVQYVEKDMDAAVSYGSIDLKFKNTLECPVQINAYVTEGQVAVYIEAI